MARKGARGGGKHQGNRLADMSLPPEKRGRHRTTRSSRKPVPAQLQHATGSRAGRKRRDGERKMERERPA